MAGSDSQVAIGRFEHVIVVVLKVLLVLSVAVAVLVLYALFIGGVRSQLTELDSVASLQSALQHVFAGVLLVLLGLELIETLNAYSADHHVRIEVILVVAMIALGRHIVQMDFEHLSGPVLLGVAGLMIALAASYFVVRRSHRDSDAADRGSRPT